MSLLEFYEMIDTSDEIVSSTDDYLLSVAKRFNLCKITDGTIKSINRKVVNGRVVTVGEPINNVTIDYILEKLLYNMRNEASTLQAFYNNIDNSKDEEIQNLYTASDHIEKYIKNNDVWNLNLAILIKSIPNFIYLDFSEFTNYGTSLVLRQSINVEDIDQQYSELCESLSILETKKNNFYSNYHGLFYRSYQETYPDEYNRLSILENLVNSITLYYVSVGKYDKLRLGLNDCTSCTHLINEMVKDGRLVTQNEPYIDRFFKVVDDKLASLNSLPESLMVGYRFKGE